MIQRDDRWKSEVRRKGWRNAVWLRNTNDRDLMLVTPKYAFTRNSDEFVFTFVNIVRMSEQSDPDVAEAKRVLTHLTKAYQDLEQMGRIEKFLALDMIVEKLYRNPACSDDLKVRLNGAMDAVADRVWGDGRQNEWRDHVPDAVNDVYGKEIAALYFWANGVVNAIAAGRHVTSAMADGDMLYTPTFRTTRGRQPAANRAKKTGTSRKRVEMPGTVAVNRVTDVAGQFKKITGIKF